MGPADERQTPAVRSVSIVRHAGPGENRARDDAAAGPRRLPCQTGPRGGGGFVEGTGRAGRYDGAMKAHRTRRVLKWVGLAVTGVMIAAWVVNGRHHVRFNGFSGRARCRVALVGGCVCVWDASDELNDLRWLEGQVRVWQRNIEDYDAEGPSWGSSRRSRDEARRLVKTMLQITQRHISTHTRPYEVGSYPTDVGIARFSGYQWWPGWWMGKYPYVTIPLWPMILLVGLATLRLWWRDRRCIPAGHCLNCRYDLTGNVSGVCPECGTAVCEGEGVWSLEERLCLWVWPELRRLDSVSERKRALRHVELMFWGRGLLTPSSVGLIGVGAFIVAGIILTLIVLRFASHRLLVTASPFVLLGCAIMVGWLSFHLGYRGPGQRILRRYLRERGMPTCVKCGYDLTGNVSGRCPECGKAT